MRLKLALAVLALTACASTPEPGAGPRPSGRNVLLASDFPPGEGLSAHDVISRLRPGFLGARGTGSLGSTGPDRAVVYLDDFRLGGVEALKNINAQLVSRIEYLSAADATTRFGTDHTGGAILLTTRR